MVLETVAFQAERYLYRFYGCDSGLAEAMAHVFNITRFTPSWYIKPEDGIRHARTGRDWTELCLYYLLREEKSIARRYLEQAIEAERATKGTRTGKKSVRNKGIIQTVDAPYHEFEELILARFDSVCDAYAMIKPEEINKLRREVAPIQNYFPGVKLILGTLKPPQAESLQAPESIEGVIRDGVGNTTLAVDTLLPLKIRQEAILAVKRDQ